MKPWMPAIALAGLGVTAHVLIREPPAAPDRSGPAPARPSPPPRAVPAARLAAPQLTRSAQLTAADEPGQDQAAPGPGAARPPDLAEVRDRLDGLFHAERVDPAWSQDAARTLDRKLPALLPTGSAVRGVDCRGSLCRIETSHTGADAYRAFVQRAFLTGETELWNAGFFTSVLAEPVAGQPLVTVAYLAREGQSLPAPEQLVGPR